MKVSLDMDSLHRSIKDVKERLQAVEGTMDPGGRGEVACSRRRKMAWERRKSKGRKENKQIIRQGKKTPSGWVIANIARQQGRDPFDYPTPQARKVMEWVEARLASAIDIAAKTGKPQKRTMERVLQHAAEMFAEIAVNQITRGRLRPNAYKYRLKKERMVKAGYGLRKFGVPPPPLVWTGRFYQGIRARFRRAFTPGRRS